MPESIQTDLAVLGGGPGGYAAAFLAADKGMPTTLIDAAPKPGGTCLHVGCIPSKTLLHVAGVIHQARDAADFGLKFPRPEIDLARLRAKGDKIIDANASHLLDLCKRRGVTHIPARGVFIDANTIQVVQGQTVHFKNAIVATGSLPVRLAAFFDLKSPRILDSTAALALADVPKSLLVVGGGYIGLELGTVYAALGSEVTVVEMMGALLPGVDADLVQPLAGRLKNEFKAIYLNTKVAKVEEAKGGIRAVFEGEVQKDAVFDKLLVSVGRRPNSANLGLDKAGVELDAKGFITVNEQRRTSAAHIFAIGDVAGEPMLAHKASHEGKLVVQVLAGEPAIWEPRAIPAVVFTDPEIAWCGLTTTEAEQQDLEVKVGKFRWASSGRAATLGRSDGLTKVITDPKTDRILGVGLVGPGAGELIAEGVVAIEMGATARDLALCIHPHPTLTETISEAAEMLHGLSSHIYVQRKKVL